MQQAPQNKFQYWDESLLRNAFPKPRANRYLVFDKDNAGLNNIRIVFEYVVVLAALTGRTLVIPPKSEWYLINTGPMPKEKMGGTTEFGDIFDLDALAKAIPVISTAEFIQRAATHLDIPEQFQDQQQFNENHTETNPAWSTWLLNNSEIPAWNPYDTVICIPDIESALHGPHMNENYLDGRTPVELSARMNAAPVIYFPSTDLYRSLGPVATMLASSDDKTPTLGRRLLKHHVRYHPKIFDLANTIIKALGLKNYDAIQIRRNDFQYKRTRLSTDVICNNINALFDKGYPIYVATDEDREEIFDELKTGLKAAKIISWKDVEKVIKQPIPYAWTGPLEQLICVPARRFVGTDLSTFCTYISRLRGYSMPEDTNSYYHSNQYTDIPEPTPIDQYRGRTYLREHPLFWQSC